jgi:hypothetical protein
MADQLRERQDTAIWNAIEANNFKQALKLVDKRLAKRHTDYLEVRGTDEMHMHVAAVFSLRLEDACT